MADVAFQQHLDSIISFTVFCTTLKQGERGRIEAAIATTTEDESGCKN